MKVGQLFKFFFLAVTAFAFTLEANADLSVVCLKTFDQKCLWEESREVIDDIFDPVSRLEKKVDFAVLAFQHNKKRLGKRYFRQAKADALQLSNRIYKIDALRDIAAGQQNAGLNKQAVRTLEQAAEFLMQKNEEIRAVEIVWRLSLIADRLHELNRSDRAAVLFEQALQYALPLSRNDPTEQDGEMPRFGALVTIMQYQFENDVDDPDVWHAASREALALPGTRQEAGLAMLRLWFDQDIETHRTMPSTESFWPFCLGNPVSSCLLQGVWNSVGEEKDTDSRVHLLANLGLEAAKRQDFDLAEKTFKKARQDVGKIESDASRFVARLTLANQQAKAGYREKASEMLNQAQQDIPATQTISLLFLLSQYQAEMGFEEDAKTLRDKIWAEISTDLDTHCDMALSILREDLKHNGLNHKIQFIADWLKTTSINDKHDIFLQLVEILLK